MTSYLMDSASEGMRLEAKTIASVAEAQLRRVGLARGMTALDVGCGSGAVTRVMSSIVGGEGAVGVDGSAARVDLAIHLAGEAASAACFVQGSADELPFEDVSFDLAWSRFLFEYLPAPQAVLREMIRVVKPGGIVAVADLDHQLQTFQPMPDSLASELNVALQLLRANGLDPEVGRKLFPWFHAAGLQNIRVQVQTHQLYAGPMPERDLANWTQKLQTSAARLTALTGEAARWKQLTTEMQALFTKDDFFYYAPLIIVSGTVPLAQPPQ